MDIWYTGLFINDPDKLTQLFSPKHERVFAHHSTIAFEPNSLDGLELGKYWNIKIIGRAIDEKGDALLVENPKSKNKHPHITISCRKDIGPIYSNELLEKAIKNGTIIYFDNPFFIDAIEGYADHGGKTHLSS